MARITRLAAAALLLAALPPATHAQEPASPSSEAPAERPASLLTLEAVEVRGPEGQALGPESLARLTVKLANRGERTASALVFTVRVAGSELPVYRNQVFLKAVPAGGTAELPLYNFWTGETGRPAPTSGKLEVEVTLREARWVEVKDEEGVEVWTPVGPVEGLPVAASTVVTLAPAS